MRRLALALAFFLAPMLAAAAEFPVRTIRIILPYAAGGGGDVLTRHYARKLGERLGQPVVVDNRPGAGATIGTAEVAKAAPDGYTLLVTASTMTISAAAYAKLPYDAVRDFAPIAPIARSPYVLAVHPSVPARSVAELIALARAQPGRLDFGSGGNGTIQHLCVELLRARTGIQAVHVPFKGSAPAVTDLVAGRLTAVFDTVAALKPHIDAKRLNALAVTTAERAKALPEVASMIAAGVPDFDVSVWFGLLAPAGTPVDVVKRLAEASRVSLTAADSTEFLAAQGLELMSGDPASFSALIAHEIASWTAVVKAANIKLD